MKKKVMHSVVKYLFLLITLMVCAVLILSTLKKIEEYTFLLQLVIIAALFIAIIIIIETSTKLRNKIEEMIDH